MCWLGGNCTPYLFSKYYTIRGRVQTRWGNSGTLYSFPQVSLFSWASVPTGYATMRRCPSAENRRGLEICLSYQSNISGQQFFCWMRRKATPRAVRALRQYPASTTLKGRILYGVPGIPPDSFALTEDDDVLTLKPPNGRAKRRWGRQPLVSVPARC